MRLPRHHASRSRSRSIPRTHHATSNAKAVCSQTALLKKPTTAAFKLVSRVVELTTPKKPTNNSVSHASPQHAKKAKKHLSRKHRPVRRCPNAPYNTTSYIIDLHRNSEDSMDDMVDTFSSTSQDDCEDDLLDFNFDTSVLGYVLRGDHDSYEISSVYEISD